MVNPNWGMLQPVDVGARIQEGYQQGRQIGAQNALSQYAANPDSPDAMNALAKFAPQYAIKVREDQAAKAAQAQKADIQRRAATGDPAAVAELAGIDFDAWRSLGEDKKKVIKDQTAYIGQSALRISQMPADQQPQAWDAYIQQGVRLGYTGLQEYQGQYSQEGLQSAIANAGLVEKLFDLEKPQYMTPASDEDLVNIKDPAALAAFQASRTGQQAPQAGQGDLEAQAQAAIAAGADPVAVRARMKELGGQASPPATFPG